MKFILSFLFLSFFSFSSLYAIPTLYVTGDIRSEIEPCGCSEDAQFGGIKRRSTYYSQHESQKGLWLDLGEFSMPPTPQGLLKTALLAKSLQEQDMLAILPGPTEFSRGKLNFEKFVLPYVVSNLKKELPNTMKKRSSTADQLDVYGYLSPSFFATGTHQSPYLNSLNSFLKKFGKEKKSQSVSRVLLFRGSEEELRQIDQLAYFDLIIPANLAEEEENQKLELEINGKNFFIPPMKGQAIMRLTSKSKRWTTPSKINDWLDEKYADDPAWTKEFKAYEKQVVDIFYAQLGKKSHDLSKLKFQGAETCIQCHQEQGKIWQGSKHASAWEALENVGKNFDPECVICHSVGYDNGGFLSKKVTPHLANVQCENCHGETPSHIENLQAFKTTRKKVQESTCKQCHVGSHSPTFSFPEYWKKIKH